MRTANISFLDSVLAESKVPAELSICVTYSKFMQPKAETDTSVNRQKFQFPSDFAAEELIRDKLITYFRRLEIISPQPLQDFTSSLRNEGINFA